jgi:hypothetical protein
VLCGSPAVANVAPVRGRAASPLEDRILQQVDSVGGRPALLEVTETVDRSRRLVWRVRIC